MVLGNLAGLRGLDSQKGNRVGGALWGRQVNGGDLDSGCTCGYILSLGCPALKVTSESSGFSGKFEF